jgi:hypothetical protein
MIYNSIILKEDIYFYKDVLGESYIIDIPNIILNKHHTLKLNKRRSSFSDLDNKIYISESNKINLSKVLNNVELYNEYEDLNSDDELEMTEIEKEKSKRTYDISLTSNINSLANYMFYYYDIKYSFSFLKMTQDEIRKLRSNKPKVLDDINFVDGQELYTDLYIIPKDSIIEYGYNTFEVITQNDYERYILNGSDYNLAELFSYSVDYKKKYEFITNLQQFIYKYNYDAGYLIKDCAYNTFTVCNDSNQNNTEFKDINKMYDLNNIFCTNKHIFFLNIQNFKTKDECNILFMVDKRLDILEYGYVYKIINESNNDLKKKIIKINNIIQSIEQKYSQSEQIELYHENYMDFDKNYYDIKYGEYYLRFSNCSFHTECEGCVYIEII